LERYEAPKARSLSYSLSTRREYLPNQLLEEQMVQSPGSSRPSGSEALTAAPAPKRKPRIKKQPNWEKVAKALQLEVEALQAEMKRLTEEQEEVTAKHNRMKTVGWDERYKMKLQALEHFYGRVLNAQTHCAEDKEYLNTLLKDAQYVMSAAANATRGDK
jgi:hypothetical protein